MRARVTLTGKGHSGAREGGNLAPNDGLSVLFVSLLVYLLSICQLSGWVAPVAGEPPDMMNLVALACVPGLRKCLPYLAQLCTESNVATSEKGTKGMPFCFCEAPHQPPFFQLTSAGGLVIAEAPLTHRIDIFWGPVFVDRLHLPPTFLKV